ncbi:MAG: hypothetical protein ACQ9MH_19855 [Nitrospinales bacterium]
MKKLLFLAVLFVSVGMANYIFAMEESLMTVPKPRNMILMGIGLIVLVGVVRRRIFKK